jgi:site-specific DNA-adenine methylase
MIEIGIKNYIGGKSGAGTYQFLINHIPEHDVFISAFLGNCGVTRYIKPAALTILIERDRDIFQKWEQCRLPLSYNLKFGDCMQILPRIKYKDDKRYFIYLDPPYILKLRSWQTSLYYRHEFNSSEEHTELIELLFRLTQKHKNIMFMINTYPSDLYESLFSGYKRLQFRSQTRSGARLEHVYLNYDPIAYPLHDYSFIGANFTDRQRIKEKVKRWKLILSKLDQREREFIIREINNAFK